MVIRGSVKLGASGLDLAIVGNLNETTPALPALTRPGIGSLVALVLGAGLGDSPSGGRPYEVPQLMTARAFPSPSVRV